MLPPVLSQVFIQSFKHDGRLHRSWDQGFVLQADENRFVAITDKTWVSDEDGRRWYTREPALYFLYTKAWFNVIAMLRQNGVYYYCNLASPALYDGEAIKYIDYDLDYKIFPDGRIILLDQDEYQQHSESMHYPDQLDAILKKQMAAIVQASQNHLSPFDPAENEQLFQQYLQLLQKD